MSKSNRKLTPTRVSQIAKAVQANGWPWHPIDPQHGKRPDPRIGNWRAYEPDVGDIERYADCGVGIRCGKLRAVDIDVRNAAAAEEIEAAFVRICGKAPRRIGSAPKSILLYRTDAPGSKLTGKSWRLRGDKAYEKSHKVEILGDGQQFVAYGIHPDTRRPYGWNGAGSPADLAEDDVPRTTEAKLNEALAEADKILAKYGTERRTVEVNFDPDAQRASNSQKVSSDYRRLLDVMASLPNEGDRDEWVRIGQAFYNACGKRASTDEAYAVWDTWSAKHESYNTANTRAAWKSFAKPSSRPAAQRLGAGTIFEYDKRYTVKKPPRIVTKKSAFVDLSVSASDLATMNIAPVKPLFEGAIYPGAYLITGRPKIGKSWLILQMGIAAALGRPFLDFVPPAPRGVLYIAAEDNYARLQYRLNALAGVGIKVPKNMRILNQEMFVETAAQCAPHMTLCEWLERYIERHQGHGVALIDTETTVRQIWDGERDIERLRERATEQDYRQTREFDQLALRTVTMIGLANHAAKRKGEWADIHELINRTGTAMAGVSGSISMADPPGHSQLDETTRRRVLGLRGRDLTDDLMLAIENSVDDPSFRNMGAYSEVEQTRNEDVLLQAVSDLQEGTEYVRARDIADETGAKINTVQRALSRMAKAGRTKWRGHFVEVKRGPGGGIRLTRIAGGG